MFQDKIKQIQEKVKSSGIVISRVPNKTRDDFVAIADLEFAGDYGLLLKYLLEQAIEYQSMKATFFENIDMKLNHIIENISQSEQKEQDKVIKTLSGRELKGGNK